jgi:hypothetical protein
MRVTPVQVTKYRIALRVSTTYSRHFDVSLRTRRAVIDEERENTDLLYNRHTSPRNETCIYKTELISRRGEFTAWGLALLSLAALVGLVLTDYALFWMYFFVGFLWFAALSISLGNWMDRRTEIVIGPEGVSYQNGLRYSRLAWNDIQSVRTFPATWGEVVQVLGDKQHFEFKTLGEVKFRGEVRGRVGFALGREILDQIVRNSELIAEHRDGKYYYYRRQ